MKRTPLDINSLVVQVIERTEARWRDGPLRPGGAIQMQTKLAPALPAVYADESELREALISLVTDVANAMSRGGALTIRTHQSPSALSHDSIQVEIRHSGVGMDETPGGRGLAPGSAGEGDAQRSLRQLHSVMRRQGGSLEIDSTPGSGTTVLLSLPSAETPVVPTTDWAALDDSNAVPGLSVLLIDDDPLLVRSVGEALTDAGHRVRTANGGREGIDAFSAALADGATFNVVITDLGMPQVDGRQVAMAIKHLSPQTPVVMLTGWGHRMAEDGDCPPGVDHLMSKPPRIAVLQQVLAKCLSPTGSSPAVD